MARRYKGEPGHLYRRAESVLSPHDYSRLWEMYSYGPLRPGEFCWSHRLSHQNHTVGLKRMVKLGLVYREPDGAYDLTDKGMKFMESAT